MSRFHFDMLKCVVINLLKICIKSHCYKDYHFSFKIQKLYFNSTFDTTLNNLHLLIKYYTLITQHIIQSQDDTGNLLQVEFKVQ